MKRIKIFGAAALTLIGCAGAFANSAKSFTTVYKLVGGDYIQVTGTEGQQFKCNQNSLSTCLFTYLGNGVYSPIQTGTYSTIVS